jgi:two-component sensor histidine kinase
MMCSFELLDRIPLGIFVIDRNFCITYWNPCMHDWTGLASHDIIGQPLQAFCPDFMEARYATRLLSVFDQGTPVILTYRLHGNLFPNRDALRLDRVYHTSITRIEMASGPAAMFTLEDRTEVSNRIRESREEINRRTKAEQQLRAALAEKELLFKEIHHRIKNNLHAIASLIRLQMGSIKDAQTINHLADLESRIHSFALLHEALYNRNVYDHVDAADYLGAIIRQLHESGRRDDLTFELDLHHMELPVKQALHLGLAMVELLTNALKYGCGTDQPPCIKVSLTAPQPGQACLRVQDRGPGLPTDHQHGRADSLGLRLVDMMAAELQGTIRFSCDHGTTAMLDFSIDNAPNG